MQTRCASFPSRLSMSNEVRLVTAAGIASGLRELSEFNCQGASRAFPRHSSARTLGVYEYVESLSRGLRRMTLPSHIPSQV